MSCDSCFGPLLEEPFLTGVYLAVNAISDAYLVIDGPSCATQKLEQFVRNHDLNSTMTRRVKPHRVAQTDLEDNLIVFGEEDRALEILQAMASQPDAGVVLFTGLTCAVIMGRDQQRIVSSLKDKTSAPVLSVASRVSSGDWLTGYAESLNALASGLPLLPHEESMRPRVGIVGYVHTRHEGDSAGDVQELTHLVESLGAEVVSIWLDGSGTEALSRIGLADVLIALPGSRKAAKLLAQRTGATVLELPLPFSWKKSQDFLAGLAEALDAMDILEAVLSRFLKPLADGYLFLAERYLFGTRWMFLGDPRYHEGLVEWARDCGAELVLTVTTARMNDQVEGPTIMNGDDPTWLAKAQALVDEKRVDLVIGNGVAASRLLMEDTPFVEFSYPCYMRHLFLPTPSLGFSGGAWFSGMLAEALCRKETLSSLAKPEG